MQNTNTKKKSLFEIKEIILCWLTQQKMGEVLGEDGNHGGKIYRELPEKLGKFSLEMRDDDKYLSFFTLKLVLLSATMGGFKR